MQANLTLNGKIALAALNKRRSSMSKLDYEIAKKAIIKTYGKTN